MLSTPGNDLFSHRIHIEGQWLDQQRLDKLVDLIVDRLAGLGVTKEHHIAVISRSSWFITLLFHACYRSGISLYPLDPDISSQRREALIYQAGIEYIVNHDDAISFNAWDPSQISLTDLGTEYFETGEEGLVVATSGSSGEPKGVKLSYRALQKNAYLVNRRLEVDSKSLWLNCLPLFHIGGLSIIVRTALEQAEMLLHQGFNADRVWSDIRNFPISHISLVPAMLKQLIDTAESPPPSHLRVVLVGGSALNDTVAKKALELGWPIWTTYGMSETASQIATSILKRSDFSDQASSVGVLPLDDVQCRIIDELGKPTTDIGRVKVKADFLMTGYANPNRTKGVGIDPEGWFVTNDLGKQNDDNTLTIIGRADEMLISGGKNIYPAEVEALVNRCPGIDNLCVDGINDPVWGNRLCVVYEGNIAEHDLKTWCELNISSSYRPRQFQKMQQLPRLSNGKLDKETIRQIVIK